MRSHRRQARQRRQVRAYWLAWLLGYLLATTALAQPTPGDVTDAATACAAAAASAEQVAKLPAGLLLAIGQVESGRLDPPSLRIEPWPWTANHAGAGHYFASAQEAVSWAAAQLALGVRSIDVGCFQVNLQFHPNAFASLPEAFDPASNARYAAGFLRQLYGQTGSWPIAVALYHSADPLLGSIYRSQVFAAWGGGGAQFDMPPSVSAGRIDRVAVRLSARAAAVRVEWPGWASARSQQPAVRPGVPKVFTPAVGPRSVGSTR